MRTLRFGTIRAVQQPNCRTLLALATCFIPTGCAREPLVREHIALPTVVSLSEANRVAAYAEKGMRELTKRGVAIGKLESYGNTQPVQNEGKTIQGFSLHYAASYEAKPVCVNAWIELTTANGRVQLSRGSVAVSDAKRDDFIEVAL